MFLRKSLSLLVEGFFICKNMPDSLLYQDMIDINFKGRKEALQKIIRYHRFPVMMYRSNLWQHSHRLAWMIEEVGPFVKMAYPKFNTEVAQLMALIHDDLEIALGDIMLAEKLKYSAEQMKDLHAKEQRAIDQVSAMFPKMIGNYNYTQLLQRYQNLDVNDVEAVVVKYFDKFDAFGEALHEVHAGNESFSRPYEAGLDAPIDVYLQILQNFSSSYPLFEIIRDTGHPLFTSPKTVSAALLAAYGAPHTLQSLNTTSEYTPYQTWKQNVLKYGGEQGKEWLLTKVE